MDRTAFARIDRELARAAGTTAALRSVRRAWSRRLAAEPPREVLRLALRLVAEGGVARRFVGYELVHYHRSALAALGAGDLARFGRGLDSWGAVDCFASYLAGPAWRERQVSDATIRRWARSSDRWWRRAALVSTVPLNNRARGGRGDTARTLAICRLLVADRDDMVVKAMSWALRELAKRDAGAARRFLSAEGERLAPRVRRELRNKLETGLKNPRRG